MLSPEQMQTVKVALILCSCFFAYGTYWSDWAFDYYLLWANPADHPNAVSRAILYYTTQTQAPDILKYIPFVNLIIGAIGFSAGLAHFTEGNILFDGASLVLMLFGLSTHATSVRPGLEVIVSTTEETEEVVSSLKNIAAAHFIIVLAITGIIGLQIAHYFVMKKTAQAEQREVDANKKSN
ncbi:ER membrane protein SH3 [Phascolomyces articulosus]|uniref:ER membrane protein SH3 n=1 Tax=Phascolomyces articulosus TaxID=60185 RepID=A0AAD5PJ87_9FUNG|nr:ER membrane protein SH3 [Phascolomyces articulosus]